MMHFTPSSFFAALAAALLVAAVDISVDVGAGGLQFTPDRVTAKPGDRILFNFKAGNHSVTQSSFAAPCTPLAGGGDSGFQFVSAPGSATPGTPRTVPLTVPSTTAPLWFFCKQSTHCSQGMVFSINAPATGNTADAYKANALKAVQSGAPSSTPPPTTGSTPPPTTGSTDPNTGAGSTPPSTGSTTPPTGTDPTTGGTGTTGTGTGTTGGQEIFVTVSPNKMLQFQPDRVTANTGDKITFVFAGGNHTATQSTFAAPCSPMAGGQDSGFAAGMARNFSVPVTDATKPMWFFCAQTSPVAHCGMGMVFSVNAPASGNTADAFKAAAMGTAGSAPAGGNTTDPNGANPNAGSGAGSVVVSAAALWVPAVLALVAGLL